MLAAWLRPTHPLACRRSCLPPCLPAAPQAWRFVCCTSLQAARGAGAAEAPPQGAGRAAGGCCGGAPAVGARPGEVRAPGCCFCCGELPGAGVLALPPGRTCKPATWQCFVFPPQGAGAEAAGVPPRRAGGAGESRCGREVRAPGCCCCFWLLLLWRCCCHAACCQRVISVCPLRAAHALGGNSAGPTLLLAGGRRALRRGRRGGNTAAWTSQARTATPRCRWP